jgi:cell division protein ZapA (FtsZ GTPase activity inhibitor)
VSVEKKSVTVRIASEDYTIRSSAEEDHTKRCAQHVDERLRDIKKQIGILEGHRAAILAALSITDELLQAKDAFELIDIDLVSNIDSLTEELEAAIVRD